MFLIEVALVFVLVLIVSLVIYLRWHYGTLEGLGIPVIGPFGLLGSSPTAYKEVSHLMDLTRAQEFGPTYGAYEGRQPTIYTSDPQLIKTIFALDAGSHFHDRVPLKFGHPVTDEQLDFLPGEKWRFLRSSLSKGFTSSRVKSMVNSSVDIIEPETFKLKEKAKTEPLTQFDPRGFFNPIAVMLASKFLLGIHLNKPESNPFMKLIRSFFVESITEKPTYFQTFNNLLPFISKLTNAGPFSLDYFPSALVDQFVDHVTAILQEVKVSKIQLDPGDIRSIVIDLFENVRSDSKQLQDLRISKATLYGQLFEMFMGFYQGFPAQSSYFFYCLAMNPAAQEKLLEEIDAHAQDSTAIDSRVDKYPYLVACLKEAFRLFPDFHRLDRICTADWRSADNSIRIPRGVKVIASLYPLFRSPEYFPEPERFDPERFLGDRGREIPPYAFSMFGFGPRTCIAQKLALETSVLLVSHMLRSFKVQPSPGYKMELFPGFGPFIKPNKIYVELVLRA